MVQLDIIPPAPPSIPEEKDNFLQVPPSIPEEKDSFADLHVDEVLPAASVRGRNSLDEIPGIAGVPVRETIPIAPSSVPASDMPQTFPEEVRSPGENIKSISDKLSTIRSIDLSTLSTQLNEILTDTGEISLQDAIQLRQFIHYLAETANVRPDAFRLQGRTLIIPFQEKVIGSSTNPELDVSHFVLQADSNQAALPEAIIPVPLWEELRDHLADKYPFKNTDGAVVLDDINLPQNTIFYKIDEKTYAINKALLSKLDEILNAKVAEIPEPTETWKVPEPVTEEDDTPPNGIKIETGSASSMLKEKVNNFLDRNKESIAEGREQLLRDYITQYVIESGTAVIEYTQDQIDAHIVDSSLNWDKVQNIILETEISRKGFHSLVDAINNARPSFNETPAKYKEKYSKKRAQELEALEALCESLQKLFPGSFQLMEVSEGDKEWPKTAYILRTTSTTPSSEMLKLLEKTLTFAESAETSTALKPAEKESVSTPEPAAQRPSQPDSTSDTSAEPAKLQTTDVDGSKTEVPDTTEDEESQPERKGRWLRGLLGKTVEVSLKLGSIPLEWQKQRQQDQYDERVAEVDGFMSALNDLDLLPEANRSESYYASLANSIEKMAVALAKLINTRVPLEIGKDVSNSEWDDLKVFLEKMQHSRKKDGLFSKAGDIIPNFSEKEKDFKTMVRVYRNADNFMKMLNDLEAYVLSPIGETKTADVIRVIRSNIKSAFLPERFHDTTKILRDRLVDLPKVV